MRLANLAEALHSECDLTGDKELREKFKVVVTVDNKPIYDQSHGDGIVIRDKRMAIDMLLVRRDFRENNMVLRWVDTRQMPADCLTKTSADPNFLRFEAQTHPLNSDMSCKATDIKPLRNEPRHGLSDGYKRV